MRAEGMVVHETVMSFAEFEAADEVFLSGNMMKVTPVAAFEDRQYQPGPVTERLKHLWKPPEWKREWRREWRRGWRRE
jgi:branched-chain amino acid aminotransferase